MLKKIVIYLITVNKYSLAVRLFRLLEADAINMLVVLSLFISKIICITTFYYATVIKLNSNFIRVN